MTLLGLWREHVKIAGDGLAAEVQVIELLRMDPSHEERHLNRAFLARGHSKKTQPPEKMTTPNRSRQAGPIAFGEEKALATMHLVSAAYLGVGL